MGRGRRDIVMAFLAKIAVDYASHFPLYDFFFPMGVGYGLAVDSSSRFPLYGFFCAEFL
jgi:hypothetical protein